MPRMSATARELLGEIEGFLAQFGLTPSKFGVAAVNDGHLVAKLRRGNSITLKTADRVRAYMASRRSSPVPEGIASREATPIAHRVLLIVGGGIAAYKASS